MAVKLEINEQHVGYFTELWKRIYEQFSTKPFPKTLINYPPALRNYFDCVYYPHPEYLDVVNSGEYYLVETGVKGQALIEDPHFTVKETNKALVGFSGGKDSVATILKLREQGFDVIGMHIVGLNKMYPNEIEATRKMAEKINVPLVEVEVKQTGKSDFPDNPVKNQLITAIMIDYGIKHNIAVYAMGTHWADKLATSNIYTDWSDPQETLQAFEAFVQSRFPQFRYVTALKNYTDAYKTIIEAGHGELIYDIISCVLPLRYREHRRKANMEKFDMTIPANRCGSCQKCVTEYMNLMALDFVKRNERFIEHCIKKWQEKNDEVYGIKRKITDMNELFPLWLDTTITNYEIKELLPRD